MRFLAAVTLNVAAAVVGAAAAAAAAVVFCFLLLLLVPAAPADRRVPTRRACGGEGSRRVPVRPDSKEGKRDCALKLC